MKKTANMMVMMTKDMERTIGIIDRIAGSKMYVACADEIYDLQEECEEMMKMLCGSGSDWDDEDLSIAIDNCINAAIAVIHAPGAPIYNDDIVTIVERLMCTRDEIDAD